MHVLPLLISAGTAVPAEVAAVAPINALPAALPVLLAATYRAS